MALECDRRCLLFFECALKLTDLWITSLLFDLNHKFIDGSFAFSPGLIYILDLTSRCLPEYCVQWSVSLFR